MAETLIRSVQGRTGSWSLSTNIWLPQPLAEVFAFFADAGNLQTLTPPWLHFRILTPRPIEMADGTVIDYRLKLKHVPIRWRSEIDDWHPPHRFVDRQLRGPYREWVHTHSFEAFEGGTTVRDDVRYSVPGGRLIHDWFVGPDLQRIFEFRHHVLLDKFAGNCASSATMPVDEL